MTSYQIAEVGQETPRHGGGVGKRRATRRLGHDFSSKSPQVASGGMAACGLGV